MEVLKNIFESIAPSIMLTYEAPQARINGFLDGQKRSSYQFIQQNLCSPSTSFLFVMEWGSLQDSNLKARLWEKEMI